MFQHLLRIFSWLIGDKLTKHFKAPVSSSDTANYHFQQFVMKLPNCKESDLFISNSKTGRYELRDIPSESYGLLAHELTHYIQAMSTVLGQQIVLNWFSLVSKISIELSSLNDLVVPLGNSGRPQSNRAIRAWNAYMKEVNWIIGASLELRPQSELHGKSPWEFYDYTFYHPGDHKKGKGIALAVPSSGKLIGVPLQGDVFLEGQAQAIQWLVDGKNLPIKERIISRPVEPRQGVKKKDIYYTAIARLVEATMPGWDAFHTTALLCDVALCSIKPPMTFVNSYRKLKVLNPVPTEKFHELRQQLMNQEYCIEGVKHITQEISSRLQGLPQNQPFTAQGMMRTFHERMAYAWLRRDKNPYHFLDEHYRNDWVQRAVISVGCPPIFFRDIDLFRSLTDSQEIHTACFWMRGTFDVLNGIIYEGLQQECPFLRTRICAHNKTNVCKKGNLLNAPVKNGKGCHIAIAAEQMGLYQKKWSR